MNAHESIPGAVLCGAVADLLRSRGLPEPVRWEMLAGGNNRVYRVDAAEPICVVKQYYQHPEDPRDRFQAELHFYRYLEDAGLGQTPSLIAADPAQRLALFTWVEGRKPEPGEIRPEWVEQAVQFAARLNRDRQSPTARTLPLASEACFSLRAHVETVDRRLDRLSVIGGTEAVDQAAHRFVQEELRPAWRLIVTATRERAERGPGDFEAELPAGARCISPSDFGFHNALCTSGGLYFFDFEYAGWDDPAKLVCDFFCQPRNPVPPGYWDRMVGALQSLVEAPAMFAERARVLLPVIQAKWCCILLNEFVPRDRARRGFARNSAEPVDLKEHQLEKARRALRRAQDILAALALGRYPANG